MTSPYFPRLLWQIEAHKPASAAASASVGAPPLILGQVFMTDSDKNTIAQAIAAELVGAAVFMRAQFVGWSQQG